jgi:integrase
MKIKVRPYVRDGKNLGWRADIFVTLSDGTRVRERPVYRDGTKTAAREAAQRRAMEIAHNDRRIDKSGIPTLAAFKDQFVAHLEGKRRKESTIYAVESMMRKHLIPLFGSKRLDMIGPVEIDKLHTHLKEHAPKTARNVVSTLAKALRVAKHLKLIDALPVESFDLPKMELEAVPEFYTFEEYAALRTAAEKHDPRTLAAVLLGGDAGLRRGEIVGLEWPDVSRAHGAITLERQVWDGPKKRGGQVVGSPKSGKGRVVPMTPRLAAALQGVRHLQGARVLMPDDGRPLTGKVLSGWVKSAQRLAGLKPTGNVHILRHSFCSHLAMRGAPAKVIQELAGHAHLSTTMRYMHLAPGHKEAAIALLTQSTSQAKGAPALAT